MSMFGASEESPRMFQSDFFDLFSRTHWMAVPLLFVPASLGLIYYSIAHVGVGIGLSLGLAVLGAVAWTFTEYWLHRTFFHWIPNDTWGAKMHFFVHGVHHDWPHDRYRLVMPPAVSISLYCLFLGIWVGTLRDYGWAFHGGFVIGYLFYDLTHYYVHHGKPKSKFFKKLRRHHMSHHFNKRYMDKRYGVSNRFWDAVFRTG